MFAFLLQVKNKPQDGVLQKHASILELGTGTNNNDISFQYHVCQLELTSTAGNLPPPPSPNNGPITPPTHCTKRVFPGIY